MKSPDLTLLPQTDPLEIYRYRDSLNAVDLLGAAVAWLDFFTWLAEHPSDVRTICRELGLHARPVDVMLTLFAANGFVHQVKEVFHVTAVAREFLVKDSPWSLLSYYAALKERPVCKDYVAVLRTGKPANWGSLKTEKDWHKAMEQEDFAEQFTAAMDCRGIYLGPILARKIELQQFTRLLDVAGGSGIYACCLVAAHPHLQATVLEKPPVDQIARKMIAKRGFEGRVATAAGEMFTDAWPTDCDVHLISNVLHDWDVPQVKQLLKKSFESLRRSGMLVIHDAFLNATKTGPLPVAEYSALLMHVTEGRCYSVAEIEAFLSEVGFGHFTFIPTAVNRSVMTAMKSVA